MTDAEHELLLDNTEQIAEIARLRALVVRAVRTAISAQDLAEGAHEGWLDEVLDDFSSDR